MTWPNLVIAQPRLGGLTDPEFFTDIFTAPYLVRALVVLLILGVVGGIVGVIVNLRSMEFSVEALVHSVFPGMVVGLALGGIDGIIPGAGIVAAAAAIALTLATGTSINEAATAVVLTSFYGLGVVLSLSAGDYSGQLDALMFGRLLDVTNERLTQTIICATLALMLIACSWRSQILAAFDRTFATTQRHNLLLTDALLNAAVASIVVAASSAVGVLLVIGYLVIPGAASRLIARTTRGMVALSIGAGLLAAVTGIIAMNLNLPRPVSPQAAVSLSLILVFATALPIARLRRKRGHANA